MRLLFLSGFIFTSIGSVLATEDGALKDQEDRINYTIGHQIGSDFKRQNIEFNEQAIRQGIHDGHNDVTPLVDKKEMTTALLELKKNITNKMKKEAIERSKTRKALEKENREKGKAFMAKNQSRQGVKTMPSGLQYKVLQKGSGAKPKLQEYVTFKYSAQTLEGIEYDSSAKKGGPVTYRANGVLPGFTEAIQMMQPGAKWEIYLPPEQAYGRQGPLAHQTIILEVELLSISKTR